MQTNKNNETYNLRWEIKESDYMKRINRKNLLLMICFFIFLLGNSFWANHYLALEGANDVAMFLSRIGLILIIILFIWYYFKSKSKLKREFVREYYKIDERGISINKVNENIKSFYPWSDLCSYYSFNKDKTLPGIGSFLTYFVGNKFIITGNNGKSFPLLINDNIESELELMLSEHLKFNQPINQN